MPWGRSWNSRSSIMKLATGLLIIAVLINAFALVSRHWCTQGNLKIGLWAYLTQNIKPPEAAMPVLYPVFAVLSLIILIGDLTLNMLFLQKNLLIMPALITFSFMAGVMMITLLILWALPHVQEGFNLSYSFYLATVVAFLDLCVGFLCATELYVKRSERVVQLQGQHDPIPLYDNTFGVNETDEL